MTAGVTEVWPVPDPVLGTVLLGGGVLLLGTLVWACLLLARLTRSAAETVAELRNAATQLARMSRSVSSSALTAQEDRLSRQARKLAFTLAQSYLGDPAGGLPGAVVVRTHNASDDFVYDLTAWYHPTEGERQFGVLPLLPPHSSYDWSFRLFADAVSDDQLALTYTDSRGALWIQLAGSPVAQRREPDPAPEPGGPDPELGVRPADPQEAT